MHIHSFKKFNVQLMQQNEIKKNLSKFFLSSNYRNFQSNKFIKYIYNNKYFYKYSSISFFRRSCLITGNCRSVSYFFKLSRYTCRNYASNGFFIGLRKASF